MFIRTVEYYQHEQRYVQKPPKCLKPSKPYVSQIAVQKIFLVLQNMFVDTFCDELEKDKLFNITKVVQ